MQSVRFIDVVKQDAVLYTFLTAIFRVVYKNPISANTNNKLSQETGKENPIILIGGQNK
jgi:hypothetical protein